VLLSSEGAYRDMMHPCLFLYGKQQIQLLMGNILRRSMIDAIRKALKEKNHLPRSW
jgi:hypothetical protein